MNKNKAKELQEKIIAAIDNIEKVENKISIRYKPKPGNYVLNELNMTLIVLIILQYLGWELHKGDIIFEGEIVNPNRKINKENKKKNERSKRIDIALLRWNKCNKKCSYSVLIEVKNIRFIKHDRQQIKDSMFWSHAKYGILVNREKMEFFDKKGVHKSNKCPRPLFYLRWRDISKYPNVLEILSKKYILNGITPKIVSKISGENSAKEGNKYFRENLDSAQFSKKAEYDKCKKHCKWDYNEHTASLRLEYVETLAKEHRE
jgi:hypothetical protein